MIEKLQREDLHTFAYSLTEYKRSNPRLYFKLVGAFTKAKGQSKCVNGISQGDEIIATEIAVEEMIRELYCPEERIFGGRIVARISQLEL